MATMMDLDKDREVTKRTVKEKGPLSKLYEDFRDRKSAMSRKQSEESDVARTGGMGSMKNVSPGTGRGTTTFDNDKTFKQAFAEARKSGKDSFTWKGKKYNTELAKSKSAKADEDLVNEHFDSIGSGSASKDYDASQYVEAHDEATRFKKGGMVKNSSAASRGDGCAQRGKTRGKMV